MNEKQERTETKSSEQEKKARWKGWLGLAIVLGLVVGVGVFQAGNLTGKATGGKGPQMGCGGTAPSADLASDSQPAAPNKLKLSTSKQYLTANLSATHDTFVQQSNLGPKGDLSTIHVKNNNDGNDDNIRKGLIKFQIDKMKAAQVIIAKFKIDVVTHNIYSPNYNYAFNVWGLKTAGDCSANDFSEATVRRNDLKGLDKSTDGVDNNHPCLFDGDPSVEGAQHLGTFIISSHTGTAVLEPQSQATGGVDRLAQYIQSQAAAAGGASKASIVLLITRVTQANAATKFASKEHSSKLPPRLELSYQGEHDSLEPLGDTYVQLNDSGPYGTGSSLLVKKSSNSNLDRHAVIQFRISNYQTMRNPGVTLLLDVVKHDLQLATFNIWGLKTGPGCEQTQISEYTQKNSGLGISDSSDDGVKNSHPCLYKGDKPLGTLLAGSSKVNKTVAFSSQRMRDYIWEQVRLSSGATTDVAFLITRTTSHSSTAVFASKEHTTLYPPRLKFSTVVEGEQNVCNQTCTNCPARAFSSTCVLQADITQEINGRTLKRIKIETMGAKIFFFGDWKEENVNGQRSFKSTSDYYIKTPIGLIPLKVLGGSSTTITCKPYLSIESQLADMPVINGNDAIDVGDLNAPKFVFGVRLGQHLREDYPTTPFGDCRPYFFAAVDTAIGVGDFKVNKKLGAKDVNVLLAIDPNDPTVITEVGGSSDKKTDMKNVDEAAKKQTAALKGIGIGFSQNGKMTWKSAVPVPKSPSEFDTNITKEIDGHIYGRLIVKLPTNPVALEVDGDIFFNVGSSLTQGVREQFNGGFFNRDMGILDVEKLKNLRMGVNINSLNLDYGFIKILIGAGSYSIDEQVHRFAGLLGYDETEPPQIFKTSGSSTGTKLQNFANQFFSKVNVSRKAEIRGIIDGKTNKFRIRIKAEATMSLGVKLSKQATLDVNNVNSDFDGDIKASINFKDLTKNVASGDISVQGKVTINGNKALYSLAGSSSLTIQDVKVVSLAVGVSNAEDKIGKVTLSGKLDSSVVDLTLSGHASKDSFELNGTCDVKMTPILKSTNTIVRYYNAAKDGFNCYVADVAKCGWNYVNTTVTKIDQCVSSIKCKKCALGINCKDSTVVGCIEWTCTVKKRYSTCQKCTKTEVKNLTFPEVTLVLSATLHDNIDTPITGTVSYKAGGVTGGTHNFNVETRSVCYTIPTPEVDKLLSSGFSVTNRKYCLKLPK